MGDHQEQTGNVVETRARALHQEDWPGDDWSTLSPTARTGWRRAAVTELRGLMKGHVRRSPDCRPATASVPASELFGDVPPTRGYCRACGVTLDATELLRVALHDLAVVRRRAEEERAKCMAETVEVLRLGRQHGLMPTELQRLSGLARRTIYDLLNQQEGDT